MMSLSRDVRFYLGVDSVPIGAIYFFLGREEDCRFCKRRNRKIGKVVSYS
jgi:hypothetical protein